MGYDVEKFNWDRKSLGVIEHSVSVMTVNIEDMLNNRSSPFYHKVTSQWKMALWTPDAIRQTPKMIKNII